MDFVTARSTPVTLNLIYNRLIIGRYTYSMVSKVINYSSFFSDFLFFFLLVFDLIGNFNLLIEL